LRREWDAERIRSHSDQYAWKHVADQLIGLYEQVLTSQTETRVTYAGLYEQA
jgi:hypothetical protein